jgi:hypothetical protein
MYELPDPYVPSICPYCNAENRELLDKFNAELYEKMFGEGYYAE